MAKNSLDTLLLRFSYRHFQTDGKLENLIAAVDAIKGSRVLLNLSSRCLDTPILDKQELDNRLARAGKVIAKLRRRGITADMVLGGLISCHPGDAKYKRYLKRLYKHAVDTTARTIWVDDASVDFKRLVPRQNLLVHYKSIAQAVYKINPRVQLCLIAASPSCYAKSNVTAAQLASALAKQHQPVIADAQPFTHDYSRTDILKAARTMAINSAQAAADPNIAMLGSVTQEISSGFHKSAEATQMQINLNILFGRKRILLDCFDKVGTAPGSDNIYLQMQQNNNRFTKQLSRFITDNTHHQGLRIVIPDVTQTNIKTFSPLDHNCWADILWRMGIPVSFITTKNISPKDNTNAVYILTGRTPNQLSRRQLNHVFTNGVLLDALAAETIQKMALPGLIGTRIGRPVKNIQSETLSDQSFAAPYYGHRTVLNGYLPAENYRLLKPFHVNTRIITSLLRKGKLPNTSGMVLFDNIEHNHRCAILPYSLKDCDYGPLLCPERQRHLRDVIAWLLRRRLSCFVENTPDLVPFCLHARPAKRIVLALLNVGFDWAIDSRVRLGNLPFNIKRVRELNEQGQLNITSDLQPITRNDYQYIQLTSDTAVPPMQMTILLLEG